MVEVFSGTEKPWAMEQVLRASIRRISWFRSSILGLGFACLSRQALELWAEGRRPRLQS